MAVWNIPESVAGPVIWECFTWIVREQKYNQRSCRYLKSLLLHYYRYGYKLSFLGNRELGFLIVQFHHIKDIISFYN